MLPTLQAGWLGDLTNWIGQMIIALFQALMSLLMDMLIFAVENMLTLWCLAIESIPVPDFLTQYSLDGLLGSAGPTITWLIGTFRIGECLAIIGAGFAFRLLRKLLTLGQW